MENLNIFIRSIFVDNMIFAYFLGMCSFLAVSKNVKTAFGLGIAVTFMLVISLPINYLLETYVLRAGALSWLGPEYADVDLSFLSLILFIAVIASMTQLVEMAVEKYSPSLYASLGIFCRSSPSTAPYSADRCLCSSVISAAYGRLSVPEAAGASAGCSPLLPSQRSANASRPTPTFPALSAA